MTSWVNIISGVPIAGNFTTTFGRGSPIVIDQSTNNAYYLKSDGSIQSITGLHVSYSGVGNVEARTVGINYFEITGAYGKGFFGGDDSVTNVGYFGFASLSGVDFGYLGTITANSRFGITGSRAFEFAAAPFVLNNVIYHAGNLTFNVLGGTMVTLGEVTAASVPSPAASFQTLFIDSADHKLKRKDSAGTVTIIA